MTRIAEKFLTDPFYIDLPIAVKNALDSKSRFSLTDSFAGNYPFDSYLDDTGFNIEFAIVNCNIDDVIIEVVNGKLTVDYKRSNKPLETGRRYIQRGITRKDFKLVWNIPNEFVLNEVKCNYLDGILKIHIPYSKAAIPTKVKIDVGSPTSKITEGSEQPAE